MSSRKNEHLYVSKQDHAIWKDGFPSLSSIPSDMQDFVVRFTGKDELVFRPATLQDLQKAHDELLSYSLKSPEANL